MAAARSRTTTDPAARAILGLAASVPLLGLSLLSGGRAAAAEPPAPQAAALLNSAPAAAKATTSPAVAKAPTSPATTDTKPVANAAAGLIAQAPAGQPPGGATPDGAPPAAAPESAPQASPQNDPPAGATTPATGGTGDVFNKPPANAEPRVLISEVVIEGLSGHPERERIELAAYAAMTVTPGSEVTRSELRNDLSAIYATGWFSDVRIEPVDGPLGVRLVVNVVANPVLTKVNLDPADAKIPPQVVQDTFAGEYGKTLNLNTLQTRMQELQKWYADQGYSLARVTGPTRVSPDGNVELLVRQGVVDGVEVQFVNKEGSTTNDKGKPIRGKTKLWVITREVSLKTGKVFNRRELEEDIKRLYGTGLFSDVKVTLRPVADDPGRVTIVLGIVEQSTGSLSGGLGYSQSQGVFGQVQVQDNNLLGRAWDLSTSFTYGQFGGLADITFTDPWIKGDRFRTAFRLKAFVSRDAPQVFQSYNNGNIVTAGDFYKAPGSSISYDINNSYCLVSDDTGCLVPIGPYSSVKKAKESTGGFISWYDFDGDAVIIQRIGANMQFIRPLNGGNPFKRAPWNVVVGLSAQQVSPMNFVGNSKLYGVSTNNLGNNGEVKNNQIICLAYNCAASNQLVGIRLAATMNNLNDARNPTSGNFFTIGTEQFVSVGPDSPTFNRVRASYTHFIPVKWLKFFKGCRPKRGQTEDCKQALAFQFSAGTNVGQLPPYEAFCVGGGNSVRGFYDCNLGVGRSFGEATIEYRFPLFGFLAGELFADAGSTFGSQKSVPGNPGGLLDKPGSGFSIGTGVIVTTPVGPLRLEVASRDFTGDWRFNLGIGWKF